MNKTYILLIFLSICSLKLSAQITLTQTTTNNIAPNVTASCNNMGITRDNIFYRAYNLNSMGFSSFSVTNVEFGINEISDESIDFAVEAVLYGTDSFPSGTLTELAVESVPLVSSDSQTLKTVDIAYDIITDSFPILVFGVRIPDEADAGNITRFFIGGNSDGQTEDCFFSTITCGINPPSSITSLGFPEINLVMNIIGTPTTLDIEDLSLDYKKMKISPNPVDDYINISGLKNTENYIIYNTFGMKIKKGTISENERIDIQNLPNGIYFLKFEKGNALKFIKQ